MKISFCTALKNRGWQLAQVIARNLASLRAHEDCEWIIADCGSTDAMPFLNGVREPRLRIYRAEPSMDWHASIAKNAAIRLSQGQIVMTLDADNLIGNDTIQLLRTLLPGAVLHHWSGVHYDGTYGRIAMARDLFEQLGGYDETFLPMGAQDADLLARARGIGATIRAVRCPMGTAVRNTKADSVRECRGVSWHEMQASNQVRSRHNRKTQQWVANRQMRPAWHSVA